MTSNQHEQIGIHETVASLNDSLVGVTATYQELLEKQQRQDKKRGRVDAAINEGKTAIDRAYRAAGVARHLDTLSNLAYLNMNIFNRIHDGDAARNQYLDKIRNEYSENEMVEITNALVVYNDNRMKNLVMRYTKIKEEYDKAIMQGY